LQEVLLLTKLAIPQRRACLIKRPRLAERLQHQPENSVVLVVAPAGYGKTTLLTWWAEAIDGRLAWFSLDEADNEPARFWRYVVTALRTAGAGMSQDVDALLQDKSRMAWEEVAGLMINDLSQMKEQITLVLDDYHLIHNNAVHHSLGYLLHRQPLQLQVIMLTRADPPLALARLRVQGRLSELRAADLRFTTEEMEAFLSCSLSIRLQPQAMRALADRIEGWAAGLQLAALSMRGLAEEEASAFVRGFGGEEKFVVSFLVEEVLQRQPARIQTFLLYSSVLRTLNPGLCTAVTGFADARQILLQLAADNLFVFPLEGMDEWFRFHRLFAGALRHHLEKSEPDLIPELRRRATTWFAAQGIREGVAGQLLPEMVEEPRRILEEDGGLVVEALTPREWEILVLITQGFSNQQIAEQLVISIGTVKGHINHILGKLNAQNRTEAAARARQLGLLKS
jgi:LuxR family maltose regulon positive regulatory protein